MQGFVNKAIHGLIVDNFGNEKWEEIKLKSPIFGKENLEDESHVWKVNQ